MDNFDLKRFLIENKMTRNSRLLSESSSPYTILWESSYHGGLIFITKQGKLIQDKILNELDLNPDDDSFDLEKNINEFINHPLYPSYQLEIEETEDLISDNISYLNKSPKFIQTCLQNLNNAKDYLYSKIGVVFMMGKSISDNMETYFDLDKKYNTYSTDEIFIELLEKLKYLNFQRATIVPDVLGGEDLYLDITPEAISSINDFLGPYQDPRKKESSYSEAIKKYLKQNHSDIVNKKELQRNTEEYWKIYFDVLKLKNNDFKTILADKDWNIVRQYSSGLTKEIRQIEPILAKLKNKYAMYDLEKNIYAIKHTDAPKILCDMLEWDSSDINNIKKAEDVILHYALFSYGVRTDLSAALTQLGIKGNY